MEIMKLPKDEVAMVGDLYETDIMSGINAGIDTIHVQTGVTSKKNSHKRNTTNLYIQRFE